MLEGLGSTAVRVAVLAPCLSLVSLPRSTEYRRIDFFRTIFKVTILHKFHFIMVKGSTDEVFYF